MPPKIIFAIIWFLCTLGKNHVCSALQVCSHTLASEVSSSLCYVFLTHLGPRNVLKLSKFQCSVALWVMSIPPPELWVVSAPLSSGDISALPCTALSWSHLLKPRGHIVFQNLKTLNSLKRSETHIIHCH